MACRRPPWRFGLLARCLLAPTRTHRSGLRSSRLSRPSSSLHPVLTSALCSASLAAHPDATHVASLRRPPEISRPPFAARPPALLGRALIEMDFAAFCPLVRPLRLVADSCASPRSFAPRCFQTCSRRCPLRFTTLRPVRLGRRHSVIMCLGRRSRCDPWRHFLRDK